MWCLNHTVETTSSPEAIWRCWMDVDGWPEWNDALESAMLKGSSSELALGSACVLRYPGGRRLSLRVTERVDGQSLVCLGRWLGSRLSMQHRLEPSPMGSRITHSLEVKGPLSWLFRLTLGRRLKESLPKATRKLARIAKG